MSDDDREADDAVAPARRGRRLLPIVLLLLGVLVGVIVGRALRPEPEPAPSPPPPPPPPVVEAPPPPAPAPAPEAPKQPSRRTDADTRPRVAAPSGRATIVLAGVTGAAGSVALERDLKPRLAGVIAPETSASYSVTVNVTASGGADDVTVRCNASIAALPKRTIVASLKSRADVAGEGTPREELEDTATEACIKSLVDDIKAWLKAQPSR